ncbi:hypothetical protein L0664_06885 [Octadecabacter sp. G9-8]|uniref:Uncharacterized protein n=1 Tax=Octadecabacter dasysiphoniae TaxID=2909341 RepID=A0ABS9CVJ0_9RHOB|nr:hypothetical protein [Octadecabacter dasysiphoniae]
MGLAGSLLVFTGFWHACEWIMGGRNRDTLALIPFGIVYIVLGYLIVTFTGGIAVPILALVIVLVGLSLGIMTRRVTAVRKWVLWIFIGLDILIALGLLIGLLN